MRRRLTMARREYSFTRELTYASTCTLKVKACEETSIGTWPTRYGFEDIATGLHYIHQEHEPTVLHRDIKASNIMVDSDLPLPSW